VAQLLGVQSAEDDRVIAGAAPFERHSFVAERLGAFIADVLSSEPTLLVVEDLHWLDSSSIDTLRALVARAHDRRLFVIATTRPGHGGVALSPEFFEHRDLGPLSTEDATALVEAARRGVALSPRIVRAILQRAEGLPLLVEELTQFVVDRLAHADGSAEVDVQHIPTTLSDSILERLTSLGATTRRVAHVAATIGSEVDEDLLLGATGLRPEELRHHVEALAREGLLHGIGFGERRVRSFRHAVTRDFVYGSQDEGTRRASHRSILGVLDGGSLLFAESHPDRVAVHSEGAGELERAGECWAAAARRAIAEWSPALACEHFEAALGAIARVADESWAIAHELRVRTEYGPILQAVTGWGSARANENNARIAELSTKAAQPLDWSQVYMSCVVDYVTGATDALSAKVGWLSRQVETNAAADGGLSRYLLASTRGMLSVHAGYAVRAREELESALAQREALMPILRMYPLPEPMIIPRAYLAWADLLEGDLEACERTQRAEEDSFERGTREHVAATSFGVPLSLFAHDWARAQARVDVVLQADRAPDQHTHVARMAAAILELRGLARIEAPPPAEVERLAAAAREAFDDWRGRPVQMRTAALLFLCLQSEALIDVARAWRETPSARVALTLADALLRDALALALEENVLDRYVAPEAHRLHGDWLDVSGRSAEADAAYAEARRRARLLERRRADATLFVESRIGRRAR
jgi:hypothetical protein